MTDKDSHIVEVTVKSDTPEIVQAFIYGYFGEDCEVDRNPEATFKLIVKNEELDYELDLAREKDIENRSEFI